MTDQEFNQQATEYIARLQHKIYRLEQNIIEMQIGEFSTQVIHGYKRQQDQLRDAISLFRKTFKFFDDVPFTLNITEWGQDKD